MMSTTEYLFLYSEENAGHFMYPKQVSIQLVTWIESPVAVKTTETGRDCALSVLRWHSSHCPYFKNPLFHIARVLHALVSSISGLTTLFCTWHSAMLAFFQNLHVQTSAQAAPPAGAMLLANLPFLGSFHDQFF